MLANSLVFLRSPENARRISLCPSRAFGLAQAALLIAACSGDGDTDPPPVTDCSAPVVLTDADINGGQTLPAGTCYRVESNLRLTDDLLTLEAGVVLEFEGDVGLTVSNTGKLRMNGTSAAPVILRSSGDGVTWKGVQLNASQGTDNAWSYARIEDAGSSRWTGAAYSTAAVFLNGQSRLSMDNVTISGSGGYGLLADEPAEYTFSSGRITGCDTPAYLALQGLSGFGGETVFEGNTNSYVELVLTIGEDVDADQTWNGLAIPYRVANRFEISADIVVGAGAVFEFASGVYGVVNEAGSLNADGTADAPIVFRGADDLRAFWRGIRIDSRSPSNVFRHVTFSHGGSERWTGAANSTGMLYLGSAATVFVVDSTFSKSGGYAFWAGADAEIMEFSSNTFSENENVALLHPDRVGEWGDGNTFIGNDDDAIWLTTTIGEQVTGEATWRNHGVPYKVLNRFSIGIAGSSQFTVTIAPGTTILFAEETYFNVENDAALSAVGTSDAPIVFGGFQSLRGYWRGLSIESRNDANRFEYVTFRDGGATQWTGNETTQAMVYLGTLSSAAFSNCSFENSDGYALWVGADAVLDQFVANSFTGNAATALLHPDRVGELGDTVASSENDDDAVWVGIIIGDEVTRTGTWKAIGVPYKVRNRISFGSGGATPITVTLNAGVEVLFTEEAYLTVEDDATLIVDGEPGNRVRFSGTQEIAAGFWRGLRIDSATANSISYADIAYAGSDRWTGAAESDAHLYLSNDANVTLDNVSIGPGGGHGVTKATGAAAVCTNVMFSGLAKSAGYDLGTQSTSTGCP